ncbi:hypothetical protein [Variovorax sp.]|uniref:hypothetical protein n=1 Tax=Variovorax sp. TaxID=1871043 RepID=UPI003BACD71A
MAERARQKPNVAIRLPDDLQQYLQLKAAEGYRTLTGEITMRLQWSRKRDESRGESASEKNEAPVIGPTEASMKPPSDQTERTFT